MYTYIYIYMHTFTCVCMYIYIYVCVCTQTYIYIYVYIYIYISQRRVSIVGVVIMVGANIPYIGPQDPAGKPLTYETFVNVNPKPETPSLRVQVLII